MTRRSSRWLAPLLLVLSLLVFAASASALTFVQSLGSGQVASGFSFTIPISTTTTVGNRLVLSLSTPGRSVHTVADTQGNAWGEDSFNNATGASVWSALETTALAPADHLYVAISAPQTVHWQLDEYAYPNIHDYADGHPLYNSGGYVNTPLPSSAPVDPGSAGMAGVFMHQIGLNPDGSVQAGTAGALRWDAYANVYVQHSTDTSTWKTVCSTEVLGHSSWAWMNDLHNAWMTTKIPVPAGTLATDGGGDKGLTVYNAPTNQMWDFFGWQGAAPAGTVDPQGRACDYEAAGGDYQANVATNPGYFITQPLGNGVTENNQWGRRASALPSLAGVITMDEWDHPLPDFGHVIQLIVPCADPNKQYWPATRHDGCSTGVGGFPEGARVRIDPAYVCPHGSGNATTQLAYDRAYALCTTLQKYGAVIGDQTGVGSGAAFTIASDIGGKGTPRTGDGGSCCSGVTGPNGTQWPNWYWDVGLDAAMPHLQVIAQSYRPPYAPAQ